MKILRRYLYHLQRSVVQGTLTPHQFKQLKKEIEPYITDEDSVLFFFTYKDKELCMKSLGKQIPESNIII